MHVAAHEYCAVSAAMLLLGCASASGSPLPTRDQNPFLAGFGLPGAMPARLPEHRWGADFNWGSSALVQDASDEFLIADAETRELRLTFVRALSTRWALQLELPYRETSGGRLDGFIDDWHDIFGLPEGARPIQPEDRLRLHYWRGDATLIELGDPIEGLGDASVSLMHALHASDAAALSATVSLKVPTGKDHWLNSSGAIDVSAIVAGERHLGDRWTLAAQAAATWLSEGDLLPRLQRELVWSASTGLSFHLAPAFELVLQVDAHTRVFDSELDFFNESVVATLGGNVRFGSGWTFSLGISEDVAVEHSPDVVFVLGMRKGDE